MNLSKVTTLKASLGNFYMPIAQFIVECGPRPCGKLRLQLFKIIKCYSTSVRVRFAPSPTGFIHLGGLRTALYNYLFAKSQNGHFILRIEDTDRSRIVPDSVQSIEKDLVWANIIPDESPTKNGAFGPYIQSERIHLYKLYIDELLQKGFAYRCFCPSDRIQQLRQLSKGLSYDNKCRLLTESEIIELLNKGTSYCVRFKVNINDIEPFRDLIFGLKNISLSENEGDFILLKSDGIPTYHFANIIDDHLMKISHVLRGSEWLLSTPKHLLIYKAFTWTPPVFGHLPQLLNEDGTKLSKRQNDLHIKELRNKGYSATTLLNFITSVGGGFIGEKDLTIKTMDQLISSLCIESLGTNSYQLEQERLLAMSRLDFQKKLSNSEEVKNLSLLLRNEVRRRLSSMSLDTELDGMYLKSILHWSRDRIDKWMDLAEEKYNYLWMKPDSDIVIKEIEKLNLNAKLILTEVLQALSKLKCEEVKEEELKLLLTCVMKENKLKTVNFMKLMRISMCGVAEGPPVVEIFLLLGHRRSLQRIQGSLKILP